MLGYWVNTIDVLQRSRFQRFIDDDTDDRWLIIIHWVISCDRQSSRHCLPDSLVDTLCQTQMLIDMCFTMWPASPEPCSSSWRPQKKAFLNWLTFTFTLNSSLQFVRWMSRTHDDSFFLGKVLKKTFGSIWMSGHPLRKLSAKKLFFLLVTLNTLEQIGFWSHAGN